MRPSRPRNWGTVGLSISRVSWDAIPRPFGWDWGNWRAPTTSTRVAREKKGWTQTVDQFRPGARSDFPEGARGPHCGRSDAAGSEVDELVAAADRQAEEGTGDSCQSRRRVPGAQKARLQQVEGVEEHYDRTPASRSERPV